MEPTELSRLTRMPKVELHRHLEGAARSATVAELAERHGIPFPAPGPDGGDQTADLYDFRDLEHFIDVYGLVCSVFVDRDDFYRLAYEALEDGAANGIRYVEAFISPFFHLRRGVSFATMVEGLIRGLADAEFDHGIRGRLIVDVDKPSGPALAVAVVDMAAACNRDVVIGIGGDNLEAGVDHRALRPAFDLAARLGLHRTIHAGEFDVDTVRVAVRELGCERVDHGVLVMQDPALVTEVVDRGIGFTVCPTSDIEVSKVWPTLAEHSFNEMRAAGMLVTLNSDDPTMLHNDLAAEYRTCADVFGLSQADLEALSLAGIEASWMDDTDKAAMRAEFTAAFARLHPYDDRTDNPSIRPTEETPS